MPTATAGANRAQVLANYGRLPLSFEANQGQTDSRVNFLSRGRGLHAVLDCYRSCAVVEFTAEHAEDAEEDSRLSLCVLCVLCGE